MFKVCILRLDHICFEKFSSTFWQVRCCAHRTRRSCQKYDEVFFKFCGLLRKPKLYHLVCCRLVSDVGDFSYNIILFYFVLYIVLTFFYLRLTWWNKKKMMPTILQMSLTKHYLTTNHKIPQTVSYFHFNDGVTIIFSL